MGPTEEKVNQLFVSAGKRYEYLTYHLYRIGPDDKTEAQIALLGKLLAALASFKEEFKKLELYDI